MATIVLRSGKGSPLTIAEADANINNLNNEVGTKLASSTYTAADVLTKIKTVDGVGSGLDADLLDGLNASTTHVSSTSTVVARDTSGNFSATTITADLTGNVTGNVIGNLTGTVTGNATNVSSVVAIGNGGTGANTQATARTNLGLGTMATQAASSVAITGGSITGITLGVGSGGTGAGDAASARTNLGLVIGTDVQPFSNELTAIAGATSATGFYVRLGSASVTERTITAGTNISVSNGNGVSGNPVITGSLTPSVDYIVKTGTNGSGDIGQSANRFAVIYGTSTSARYADLAERYTTDQEYETGTVITVSLDSSAEGTASFKYAQRVLGVVSAKPAFIMNDEAEGQALALRGRVPVKVAGPINKGQPLVANQDGRAIAGDHPNSFAIALETNLDPNVKLVECVIL
jgi:hypothetical protein